MTSGSTTPHDSSELAAEVRGWVDEHWRPDASLREWWSAMACAGFAFPTWPVGRGGRGLTDAAARVVSATLAEAGVIGPPVGIASNMGAPTVLEHGTDEQRRRFVDPVAAGAAAWCQLFSEPGAGSDLAAVACKAVRDGDEFLVTGQKVWNSGADTADWGMLLARTNADVPKRDGITWMLIDMRQTGVETRPLVQMNGDARFCEVFLTEARVPMENVIGQVDGGWAVARTTLAYERASVGHRAPTGLVEVRPGQLAGHLDRPVGELVAELGSGRSAGPSFDVMLGVRSVIRLARAHGLATDPIVRDRLADYHIRSEVHRLNAARARDNARRGRPGPEASIGKLSLAMLAHRSRDLSMAIIGADGLLAGDVDSADPSAGRVQRACLSSFVPSLGGGTNEIQRNIIGERSLGLPREPDVDDGVAFRELRRS